MKKKKISQTQITQTIDKNTGEIIEISKTNVFKVDREPDYIKMYISDIIRLNDLPSGTSAILLELVSQMGYNNIIPAYKPIKELTAKKLGISLNYLNKAIQTFYEKGLFIRVARGVYMADPDLFARGKWEDIKELRLVIEYKNKQEKKGIRKLKSNISEEVQLKLNL